MVSFPKVAKVTIMNIPLGDTPYDDRKFRMKNDALFFPDFCSSFDVVLGCSALILVFHGQSY